MEENYFFILHTKSTPKKGPMIKLIFPSFGPKNKNLFLGYTVEPWLCTVRKEMRCSGKTEILQELGHNTMQKSESNEIIRVVS